jgi:hypothetical protein
VQVDLAKASDMELVNYQLNPTNGMYGKPERFCRNVVPNKKVHKALKEILAKNPDATRKLRALWALHVTKGLTEKELTDLLANENEYVRSWAIQLLAEDKTVTPETLKRLVTLAQKTIRRLFGFIWLRPCSVGTGSALGCSGCARSEKR